MIRFVVGGAGSGKSSFVRDEVCRVIRETEDVAVVIVPEQQTVLWETKMAEALSDNDALRVEITNFTRLCNSVFRVYGGLSDTPIDEGSRTLLVWRAMSEMLPTLRVYGASSLSRAEKNLPKMMRAIDELKNSGITPAEAEAARHALEAEGEDGGQSGLASRLFDAVGVYAAYTAELRERGIDKCDLQNKLASTLSKKPYFKGKHVFIDSFFSLTSAEEKIMCEIMRQAESVTVTFSCSPTSKGEVQFLETEAFLAVAKSLAYRAGREYEVIPMPENHRHAKNSSLAAVEEYIFDYAATLPECADDGAVRVIKCADRYDEAECAAAIIDRLVRDGAAYSDIAVVAANMASREGVIDAVLRRHGIRCFMSESTEVSTSPIVRLIVSALRVEESAWSREEIIKMIKTGLTPLSNRGESALFAEDVFESYTETWNIRGRRMFTSGEWSMNPEGYKTQMSETSREILTLVNDAKAQLIPPLERFLDVFEYGVAPVREIAERIVYFAEELGVYGALMRMAESYRAIGMLSAARKTAGMWDAVCKILDRMTDVLGDMQLDAGTFAGLFMRTSEAFDVGSIPTGIDEVVLGSASGVRFDSVKYMIILGSVDGEFPSGGDSSRDFFDEGDKVRLEGVGLTITSPDTALCTAREYFMYYRTASAPTDGLYVIAPIGGEAELSEGATRILKITGKEAESFATMPLSEVVFTRAAAEYQLARRTDPRERALLDALTEKVGADIPLESSEETVGVKDLNVGKVRMNLSESRLESFASCPFSYTCKYLLKLSPEAEAEIKTPDIGSFVHSVLEKFFVSLSADDMVNMPLSRERTEEIAGAIIEEYVNALARSAGSEGEHLDGRLEYLFVRLRRHVLVFLDAIMRELSQSKFMPVAYEVPIGIGDQAIPPIVFRTADGGNVIEVTLRGICDRVDVYEAEDGVRYVRVVDYKTGAKTFSLDDVYRGFGVQLLIYLFSVWKSGDSIPAGAMYFSARPVAQSSGGMIGEAEARENAIAAISRSGIFLDDFDVLTAMDEKLDGDYIDVKGDAEKMKAGRGATLTTAEGFSHLAEDLEGVIGEIARKMHRGVADASPKKVGGKSPCDWCDMKFICRKRTS